MIIIYAMIAHFLCEKCFLVCKNCFLKVDHLYILWCLSHKKSPVSHSRKDKNPVISTFSVYNRFQSDSSFCPFFHLFRKHKKNLHLTMEVFCRGRRIRTLNKGFGDPRVTITPCPYAFRARELYRKTEGLSRPLQFKFLINELWIYDIMTV